MAKRLAFGTGSPGRLTRFFIAILELPPTHFGGSTTHLTPAPCIEPFTGPASAADVQRLRPRHRRAGCHRGSLRQLELVSASEPQSLDAMLERM
jgi:hypothetical protein